MKKLYRSRENRVFNGVIGGLGEYYNVDPVLLRLFWTALLILTGVFPGLAAYLIAILIVPEKPKEKQI